MSGMARTLLEGRATRRHSFCIDHSKNLRRSSNLTHGAGSPHGLWEAELGAFFSSSLSRGFSRASCEAARRDRYGSSVFIFERMGSISRTLDPGRTRSASASNSPVCSARSFREPSSAASARRAFRSASVFSSIVRAEALSRAVMVAASASSTRSFTHRNSSTFTLRARAAATSAGTVDSGSLPGGGRRRVARPPAAEARSWPPRDSRRASRSQRRGPRKRPGGPERNAARRDDSRVVRFFDTMLTQVGKYQIVEKIGVGGFGTVYKGRDPFIKRSVAIKTCQSEEEEIKKRFFREAEFAGNLHHRNVTTIYDFGVTEDGTPYIVQEFLTGDDLDKAIKKKEPLTLKRKLQILIDVCDGLGYAHSTGIIHRDIKPSNIRILEDGTVKIMDFGIAKSMVSQSTLTQTGITLGTASYLAPEQIRGEDLDPRTDIFSLGVLAYEIVTGQKPFTGDPISTVLYKIMNEMPAPPSSLDPALPRGLDAMVLKALDKDRAKRFSSCGELRAECLALLQNVPEGPAFEMPEGDMEKTVATPTSGFPVTASVSPRTPVGGRSSRVLDTPLGPAASRPTAGGIGDVRLHADTAAGRPVTAREEGSSAP